MNFHLSQFSSMGLSTELSPFDCREMLMLLARFSIFSFNSCMDEYPFSESFLLHIELSQVPLVSLANFSRHPPSNIRVSASSAATRTDSSLASSKSKKNEIALYQFNITRFISENSSRKVDIQKSKIRAQDSSKASKMKQ